MAILLILLSSVAVIVAADIPQHRDSDVRSVDPKEANVRLFGLGAGVNGVAGGKVDGHIKGNVEFDASGSAGGAVGGGAGVGTHGGAGSVPSFLYGPANAPGYGLGYSGAAGALALPLGQRSLLSEEPQVLIRLTQHAKPVPSAQNSLVFVQDIYGKVHHVRQCV